MMAPEASGNGNRGDTPQGTPQARTAPTGRSRRQRRAQNQNSPVKAKFEGRCPDLKNHIFDCAFDAQSDLFTNTQKEVADYVGRTYKYGGAVRRAIESLEEQQFTAPADPGDDATLGEQRLWEKEVDEVARMRGYYNQNLMTLYALVWGQCSDAMREKLRSKDDFEPINVSQNGLQLLRLIRTIAFNHESNKFVAQAVAENMGKLWKCVQESHESNQSFLDRFTNTVAVVEQSGGGIGGNPGIERFIADEQDMNYDAEPGEAGAMTEEQKAAVRAEAKEVYLATIFLMNADRRRYKELQLVTQNDYTRGSNTYPRTVLAAYELLNGYTSMYRGPSTGRGNDGVSFNNVGDPDGDGDAVGTVNANAGGRANAKCRKCKGVGHYERDCPTADAGNGTGATKPNEDGSGGGGNKNGGAEGKECDTLTFTTCGGDEFLFSNGKPMPKTWVLLDNQSTLDVFSNSDLLENIREGVGSMTIHCNAGATKTTLVGDLPGYGTVWYNPNGIANILSVSRVIDRGYKVTYDSKNGNEFLLEKPDGGEVSFQQSEQGLFYIDMVAKGSTFVNTVATNKTRYTRRKIARADLARRLQQTIGRPSTKDFVNLVNKNLLPNCPITAVDIMAAEEIYGPDLGSLKGKTVRHKVDHVEAQVTNIPWSIIERYRNATVCADVMKVNGIPFLVTISRGIRFGTAEMIQGLSAKVVLKAIQQVAQVYAKRGFKLATLLMDGEFESLRGPLAGMHITLNITSRDEHVPEAERSIRTLKERVRAIWNTLPFQRMPARMIIEMVYCCNFWLNCFPAADGISDTISPRALIDGIQIDYRRHCALQFGDYVQTHEPHDNSMASRTVGAIALRPTGNEQGGYFFYSLASGRRINRSNWTRLPMPEDVISHVHRLARRDRMVKGRLSFISRYGDPDTPDDIDGDVLPRHQGVNDHADGDDDGDEDDDDEDYHDDDSESESDDETYVENNNENESESESDHESESESDEESENGSDSDDSTYLPTQDDNNSDADDGDGSSSSNSDGSSKSDGPSSNSDGDSGDGWSFDDPDDDDSGQDPGVGEDRQDSGVGNDQTESRENNTVAETSNGSNRGENSVAEHLPQEGVRDVAAEMDQAYGTRTSTYGLRERKARNYDHLYPDAVFSQYSMKAGLKMFGDRATEAVLKELKQLHDRNVMEPKHAVQLSREERYQALNYLMFVKEKRDGMIKGRGCADGRKQRTYISKEEASSPTVTTEAVFLTSVIDAREKRDVATVDVPGAFMQADMDDVVHMRLDGVMVDLLIKIDSKYADYVSLEKGKRVIYVQLVKALYGTLKAAMLFWKKLSGILKGWGFVTNQYDACVANKMIDGKQCTIAWHVDDLKISHENRDVVSQIIEKLNGEFGKEAPLTVNRGKVHDYLGMTLDFSVEKKVKIGMVKYVKNMLAELGDDMEGTTPTPASLHLFETNEECPKLDEKRADAFHHYVAKLLFLCKRARPDIQTAVAFLCTRVQAPDEDDQKKLARVMRYLRGTSEMVLTLESDGMNVVKWWADASFAVHADFKSHTGGAMSLGKGVVYGMSTRQKINTRSSTEAELVAANDVMAQLLWTQNFLRDQGYTSTETCLYQDNQSAMLLEKNGRASSSKRTRHLNIRYFFITDRVADRDLRIEYCPTEEMVADFFTKPLQGALYRRLRDIIMNVDSEPTMASSQRSVLGFNRGADAGDGIEDGWTKVVRRRRASKRNHEVDETAGRVKGRGKMAAGINRRKK